MPDLLAHAFIAYAVSVALSLRYEWLTSEYVTVAMAGAFIPDITKLGLVLEDWLIEQLLGVPFDWSGIHTLGGAVVGVMIGMVLVESDEQRRVGALLGLGAATHLLADAMLLKPSGYSYAVLWPVTRWHPPTPGLYLSTEPEPMLLAGVVAIVLWYRVRRQ